MDIGRDPSEFLLRVKVLVAVMSRWDCIESACIQDEFFSLPQGTAVITAAPGRQNVGAGSMVTHLHRAKAQLAALASDHVTVSVPSPQRPYQPRAARPLLLSLALFAFWLRYVPLYKHLRDTC